MDESLARRVYDACHLTGSFLLRSGQTSSEYFDKYLFEADPALLLEVATAMRERLPTCDALVGMELGGIPLATVLSQLTGLPTAFLRKQAKEYGTRKQAEGPDLDGRHVALVEDVVTSGGALLEAIPLLRRLGATVSVAVCAIDRQQGGAEALAAQGVELRAVLTRDVLERSVAGD